MSTKKYLIWRPKNTRTRTHTHTRAQTRKRAHTHTYTHARPHTRTHVHTHARTHTQTHTRTHTHTQTHTHARTHTTARICKECVAECSGRSKCHRFSSSAPDSVTRQLHVNNITATSFFVSSLGDLNNMCFTNPIWIGDLTIYFRISPAPANAIVPQFSGTDGAYRTEQIC
jgi:hypothetical protein